MKRLLFIFLLFIMPFSVSMSAQRQLVKGGVKALETTAELPKLIRFKPGFKWEYVITSITVPHPVPQPSSFEYVGTKEKFSPATIPSKRLFDSPQRMIKTPSLPVPNHTGKFIMYDMDWVADVSVLTETIVDRFRNGNPTLRRVMFANYSVNEVYVVVNDLKEQMLEFCDEIDVDINGIYVEVPMDGNGRYVIIVIPPKVKVPINGNGFTYESSNDELKVIFSHINNTNKNKDSNYEYLVA